MKTPRSRISGFVADQTLKGASARKLSRQLAAYLLAERRTSELDSILRDVQADWAEAGYVEVIASSAHPLTAGVKADIQKQIKKLYPDAKRVNVTEEYDPEVIGGVRLNLANRQLDLSVEAKLNQFKQLTLSGKE
ncbi:MAG TPA: F0F1 ATP synthase subunit delta [Candidatus Saccharimonadia bacterium]|nr:F0F1 ATP synthase subunit delta [Candidatus Saccharimonadia bacterium]